MPSPSSLVERYSPGFFDPKPLDLDVLTSLGGLCAR